MQHPNCNGRIAGVYIRPNQYALPNHSQVHIEPIRSYGDVSRRSLGKLVQESLNLSHPLLLTAGLLSVLYTGIPSRLPQRSTISVFSLIWLTFLISFCAQAAFDPRVLASVCFFATDIHSATLGKGMKDDSLERVKKGDIKGEVMVCSYSRSYQTMRVLILSLR